MMMRWGFMGSPGLSIAGHGPRLWRTPPTIPTNVLLFSYGLARGNPTLACRRLARGMAVAPRHGLAEEIKEKPHRPRQAAPRGEDRVDDAPGRLPGPQQIGRAHVCTPGTLE